jgi:hypothetical protein
VQNLVEFQTHKLQLWKKRLGFISRQAEQNVVRDIPAVVAALWRW